MITTQYVAELPKDAIDVTEIITNKINSTDTYDKFEFPKSYTELKVYYSPDNNTFYHKKHNVYKIVKWRTQKRVCEKNTYEYKYLYIPYKRNKPIRIFESNWSKYIQNVADLTSDTKPTEQSE
jgi:hypothetical protein